VEQIGRYQILEELGRGATGVVYRALDPAIGRTVAIKSIRLGNFSDPQEKEAVREKLLREARSAGTLSHPNIVTIYDVFESGDFEYIAMEFVDGASLAEMQRRGTLPDRQALLQFLRQIAEALDYAHRKGIIHRDIKPANIIISGKRPDADPLAKIADFGVAKFLSNEVTVGNPGVIGTPNYMSPEQIHGLEVTGASDQFSLGVLVYELLCGAKPFSAESLPALFYLICKQNPQPLHHANRALNETVNKVVGERALAKQPEARFSSCCDFIGALTIALGECPEWTPPVAAVPVSEKASGLDAKETAAARVAAAEFLNTYDTGRRGERTKLREETPIFRRLGLILALFLAVAGMVIFIVRWNSGPSVPVQVADPRTSPASPPPEDLKTVRPSAPPPADLSALPAAPPPASQPQQQNSPNQAAQSKPAENPPASSPAPAHVPDRGAVGESAAANTMSDVELVSDPPGATVRVDGGIDSACTAPCALNLRAGRHTLTAVLSGYEVARKIFQVPADAGVFVPLSKSSGVLVVTSQPTGVSVSVDGAAYGHTPVTLHLPTGPHHLVLSDGSRRHEETIEIDSDSMLTRAFRW
jgi:serine/threonine-protein kinase